MYLGPCSISVFAFGLRLKKTATRIHTEVAVVAVNVNHGFKHIEIMKKALVLCMTVSYLLDLARLLALGLAFYCYN